MQKSTAKANKQLPELLLLPWRSTIELNYFSYDTSVPMKS